MRRFLVLLSVFAATALAAAPASAAWPLVTKLQVNVSAIEGVGGTTDPGQLVNLTVTAPDGAVRFVDRTVAAISGSFSLGTGGPIGGTLVPGDTLRFVLAGNPANTYAAVLPRLSVTGFNLATGEISGRVTPRQERVLFQMQGGRVVADPVDVAKTTNVAWITLPPGKKTDRDGRFTVKPAMSGPFWAGTFRRNDLYYAATTIPLVAGDPNFELTVVEVGFVPGFAQAFIGSTFAILSGPFYRNYVARLESPAGKIKGTAGTSTGFFGPYGMLDFRKADGRPGVMQAGDRIRVSGMGGFSQKVPRLKGVIDPAANSATILAKPNSLVLVEFWLYDLQGEEIIPNPDPVWVETDASGEAVITPAFTMHVGDWVQLTHMDGSGNRWYARNQALP